MLQIMDSEVCETPWNRFFMCLACALAAAIRARFHAELYICPTGRPRYVKTLEGCTSRWASTNDRAMGLSTTKRSSLFLTTCAGTRNTEVDNCLPDLFRSVSQVFFRFLEVA